MVIKKKESLKASYTLGKKRNRDPTCPDVDEALHLRFTASRAQSVPVSIKSKAEELAAELDLTFSLYWHTELFAMPSQ